MSTDPLHNVSNKRGSRHLQRRVLIYGLVGLVALATWASPHLWVVGSGGKQAIIDWLDPPPAPVPTQVERFTLGEPFAGQIPEDRREVWYELEVPEDAVSVRVKVETFVENGLDLDLFEGSSQDVVPGADPVRRARGSVDGDSVSTIAWRHPGGCRLCAFTLRVSTPLPTDTGLPFEVTPTVGYYHEGPELVMHEWQRVSLGGETGKSTVFEFDLDAPAESLHVRLDGARVDYDLSLAPADAPQNEWSWSSATRFKDESLTAAPDGGHRPGRYRLLIADSISRHSEDSDQDEVFVGISADRPLPYRHPLPGPSDAIAPAIAGVPDHVGACVVQLSVPGGRGSGVVVSPEGYIATAAHVFDDDDDPENGLAYDWALVGFVDHPALPPRESFVAERLDIDPKSDLALARIVRTTREDRAGVAETSQGLPAFPFLPLRLDELPELGAEVTLLGLPTVSSDQERSTLHVTRGVVSGFDGDSRPPRYATIDASMWSGMSGGPVVGPEGHVVGIVSHSRAEPGGNSSDLAELCALVQSSPCLRRVAGD
jgi:S1-C subfamily serine protease